MTERARFLLISSLIAAHGLTAVAAQELPRPEPRIHEVIGRIVDDVALMQEQLEQDDCLTFDLVDRHLRGEFDLQTAGQLILGDFWPDDGDARERFVKAFADSLVARYGDLIRYFNSETLKVFPLDAPPVSERLRLSAEMTFNDGETIDVILRMRYNGERWRIFDIQAEDYSYARNFRDDFRFEIPDIGFDGLIERLKEEAAPRRACGL